jgi:hypothetical protein
MSVSPILLSFGDSTTMEGNLFAGSLAETLRSLALGIEVKRVRERADTAPRRR